MTVIEEEEGEDSILQSNFNSNLAGNVTLNSQNMRTKKQESGDLRNSDLSAVMEEYDARGQNKRSINRSSISLKDSGVLTPRSQERCQSSSRSNSRSLSRSKRVSV